MACFQRLLLRTSKYVQNDANMVGRSLDWKQVSGRARGSIRSTAKITAEM